MKRALLSIGLAMGLTFLAVAPVQADGPTNNPCVFEEGSVYTCQSTDPHVTINDISLGDTSGCTFKAHVDWGDEQTSDSDTFPGGSDHSVLYAPEHTYDSAGTYTITLAGQVVSGAWCSFGVRTYTFTLVTPVGALITSPADSNIIAMTNGKYLSPQPAPNERASQAQKRSLLVKGENPCGSCSITVNGISAKKRDDTWEAKLPNMKPGELTITVQTSQGQADSVKITIIDLLVASPTENQQIPLTNEPAMPEINARAMIIGLPTTVSLNTVPFVWKLQVANRWVSAKAVHGIKKSDWHDDQRILATGMTTGISKPWQPHYSALLGGWANVSVVATIPGVSDGPVVSEPRWFDIPGANPSKTAIVSYIQDRLADRGNEKIREDLSILTHIACKESQFQQFSGINKYSFNRRNFDKLPESVPSDWQLKPQPPVRPYWGYPAGVGIMQLDPADFPSEQWDWQKNLRGGVHAYRGKKGEATNYLSNTYKRHQAKLLALLTIANRHRDKKHMPPLQQDDIPPIAAYIGKQQNIETKDGTTYAADILTAEVVRRYNGGRQWQLDPAAEYALSKDGLNIEIEGDPNWELVPRNKKSDNYDYVYKALTCN